MLSANLNDHLLKIPRSNGEREKSHREQGGGVNPEVAGIPRRGG